jgi:hypothetical protein
MDNKKGFSITKARKVLGNLADSISDEQLQNDILVAEVMKNLFFQFYMDVKRYPKFYNKNNHG